jgi:hypothetical protein
VDQLLDLGGGDRIERGAGLVHQDDLGIDGDRPGDAQPLLLPARQGGAAFGEPVLDLLPKPRPLQRLLDDRVELLPPRRQPVDPGAVGDVLVDRLGERVGLLEHHPDPGAQLNDVHAARIDVVAVQLDLPRDPGVRDGVVHPVQRAQEGRFAAARRADEGGDMLLPHLDRDVVDRPLVAIPDADAARPHLRGRVVGQSGRWRGGGGAGALGSGIGHLVHQRLSNLLRR